MLNWFSILGVVAILILLFQTCKAVFVIQYCYDFKFINISSSFPIIWYVMGIPLTLLDGNECGSVKQIRSTCKSLESPVKSEIFVTNPRIFKSARSGFFSEDLCVNKLFSFLIHSQCSKAKWFDLIILGSKSESMFGFDNDVERDKATWICPGENSLCLINFNETTIELSRVRLWTLWTVHVHAKVNGNWVLLNVFEVFIDDNICFSSLNWHNFILWSIQVFWHCIFACILII